MADTSAIINAERLVSVSHEWPAFHDAEVLSVRLDRRGHSGPTLDMDLWLRGTADADVVGESPSVDVSLRFGHVDQVELLDFGPQNVLFDMVLDRAGDRWQVRLNTSYGLCGGFAAASIEVVAVVPHVEGR